MEREFIFEPSLVLYLPLYELDGSSFMSKDKHGHLCTVTGASWRFNGRWFDGSDDFINCGNATSLQITGAFTVLLWVNVPSGEGGNWITKNDAWKGFGIRAVTGIKPQFWTEAEPNKKDYVSTTSDVDDDTWHLIGGIFYADGSTRNTTIFDGVAQAADRVGAAMSAMTESGKNLNIGRSVRAGDGYAKCSIGEVWLYNRALSAEEYLHNYIATKWRYR